MEKLPLSIRSWKCPDCKTEHDRDVNASLNIRKFALADALGHSAGKEFLCHHTCQRKCSIERCNQ